MGGNMVDDDCDDGEIDKWQKSHLDDTSPCVTLTCVCYSFKVHEISFLLGMLAAVAGN
jgi:basic membrane lipoprotein Med (substrate-binding protein (PBP1-ABC) superfamily)